MTSNAKVTLGVVALLFSGCFTTTAIRPVDLNRLDGYEASDPARAQRELQTLDGGKMTFRPGATLALDLPAERVGGRFTSISVHDGLFQGRTSDGRTVQAPVAEVRAADVNEHNVAGTAVLVGLAILLGVVGTSLYVFSTQEHAVAGRALRVAGQVVLAPPAPTAASLTTTGDWRITGRVPAVADLSPAARATLAAFWTESARAEHASVPAFSRLSLTLMAMGAPARLIEAAHRAALEEIDHARRSFSLASAYAGFAAAPGPLAELRVAPAVTATSLAELATESLIDGCLLEGVAAAAAAESLARAEDAAVRDALAAIVPDERAHAELAWSVVVWCCAEGGPAIRQHVAKLASALPRPAAPTDAPSALHAELAAHGWLPRTTWRALAERTRREVEARALRLL